MGPHSWIKKIINITSVAAITQNHNTNRKLENCETLLLNNGKKLKKVRVKRAIFQGNSFFPCRFHGNPTLDSDIVKIECWI